MLQIRMLEMTGVHVLSMKFSNFSINRVSRALSRTEARGEFGESDGMSQEGNQMSETWPGDLAPSLSIFHLSHRQDPKAYYRSNTHGLTRHNCYAFISQKLSNISH